VSRAGIKSLSETIDTLGVLARSAADAGLLVGALSGRALVPAPLERAPTIAFCRTPQWPSAQPETVAAMEKAERAAARAGAKATQLELPPAFADLLQAQIDIMNYEIYRALASDRLHHFAGMSATLQRLVENAGKVDAARYDEARALARTCRALLGDAFGDADVLVAPSAPGEAPRGLGATGDPVFNRIWTLLGTPAVTIPGGTGPNGLPVGVQVIGRLRDDRRALAVADWLQPRLALA
jgi:Asp-tRNA(Asn)/Glu-tRNA(Gln) amidotransferase A subunit family amidase